MSKTATKVAAKPAPALAQAAKALMADAKAKATRDAERAKRFPTAAKKAAEKVETKDKPKAAPVKKAAVAFVAKVAKPGMPLFAISEVNNARPARGSRLFAHTHAALTLIGMLTPARPAVPEGAVATIMGTRAIKYHLAEGNFESTKDNGLRLTSQGLGKFVDRAQSGKIDGKLANGFMDVFTTGKASADAGVKQAHIFKIA